MNFTFLFWGAVGYNIACYLGIVNQIVGDKVYVLYMRKSDKQGFSWSFPDEAEIYDTSRDQIIARKFTLIERKKKKKY